MKEVKKFFFFNKSKVTIYFNRRFFDMGYFYTYGRKEELLPGIYYRTIKDMLIIKIENNLDDIKIIYDEKVKFEQYYNETSKILEKYYFNCFEQINGTEIKKVPLNKIYFPSSMGGGISRCSLVYIQHYFEQYGVYSFINNQRRVEISNSNKFINICYTSDSCKNKINNFNMSCCSRECDGVELGKIGEYYFVSNGNHRVCSALKTGLKEIEAKVTEYSENYRLRGSRGDKIYSKEILDDFYGILKKYNLDEYDIKNILLKGIKGIELIELIEKKNKKDITTLLGF